MKKEDYPEGYFIPFHRSLTQPLYWMGVPRNFLLCEIFGTILGGVFLKTFMVLVVAVACHFLVRFLGQKDPDFYKIFWASRNYKPFYRV